MVMVFNLWEGRERDGDVRAKLGAISRISVVFCGTEEGMAQDFIFGVGVGARWKDREANV